MQFAGDELRRAAKSLIVDYGHSAEQEAEKRCSKAEKAGRKLTASFWREIQTIASEMQNE